MRLFLLSLSLVIFASCSSSKKLSKTTVDIVKKDSSGLFIDTTKTTIIEEIKEDVKIPADSLTVDVDLDSSSQEKDTTEIIAENDNLKVKVVVNKKNKKAVVKAYQKPKDIVKTTTKTTIEQKGITQKTTSKTEEKKQTNNTVKIPKVNWTLIIIASVAITILFIFLWLKLPSFRRPRINSGP
jgi:ATP-dependent Zn protease